NHVFHYILVPVTLNQQVVILAARGGAGSHGVGDVDKRLTLLVGNHKPLVFDVVNKRERLNPVLATLASTDNEVIIVGKHRSLGNTRPRFRGTVADMVTGILVQVQAVFGKRWPFGCQPVHRASTQMVAVAVSDKHGTNPTQVGAHVLDVKSNVNH